MGVSFHAIWSGGSYGRSGGNHLAFTLSRQDRLRVSTVAMLRAATASRAGVDIALPYAMAALAAVTCFYKLAFFSPV